MAAAGMSYRDERGRLLEFIWCVVFALYFAFLAAIFIWGLPA